MNEYQVKELELVHVKMAGAVSELQKIELYSALGPGLFYAWLLSDGWENSHETGMLKVAVLVPPALALLGLIRATMQRRFIRDLGEYTRYLEETLASASEQEFKHHGWESFYSNQKRARWAQSYRFVFWFGLLGSTTAASLFLYFTKTL